MIKYFRFGYSLCIASVFIWVGFVGAISFLEAWLKFQAPGVTLPIGLSIGRLVFEALNRIEWLMALIVAATIFPGNVKSISKHSYFLVIVLLLMIQTFWLLPTLDARAELRIQGQQLASTYHHLTFVVLEVIKVICLIAFGITLLKNFNSNIDENNQS